MCQGIELGPDHKVANLPKIEQITRQNLPKVVVSNSLNIDMGLLNGNDNSKKPTHSKKKSTIFPSEFSKQLTRIGGLVKDVANLWLIIVVQKDQIFNHRGHDIFCKESIQGQR